MRNSYYKCVELIKDILKEGGDVNTILHGHTEQKDLYKKNVGPLAHINPVQSNTNDSSIISHTFEVFALARRIISNDPVEDKFTSNDNEIDNLNLTFTTLANLVTTLRNMQSDDNIQLQSISNYTPVLFTSNPNLLDGYSVEIELILPNEICATWDKTNASQ